ncbi:MAG TPA: phytanoyl-CoA dioxygenase family protein [Candidatus Obscuribacterales bacterium]
MRDIQAGEMDQRLRELRAYGYTRLESLLTDAEVGKCLELLEALYEPHHPHFADRANLDNRDKFVWNLQFKNKFFLDLLVHPGLTQILKELLNDPFYKYLPPDAPNYILNYYNARSSGEALGMHMDTFLPATGDRTWTAQAAFFLEDSDIENGCTVVVPGSHRSGQFIDMQLAKVTPIPAKAGDVLMWDSRIWHGANANTNGQSRWSMIATFSCWWVKQRVDMTRGLPEAIYRELTDQQKILLGYCSIPPLNEHERLNFKCGYEALKPSVADYYPDLSAARTEAKVAVP